MIDFHCHLDLFPKPASIVTRITAQNIQVLSVTTTPSAWHGTVALASSVHIRTALGLHPQLAHERRGELELFEHLLPMCSYVGEIGLDGGPEFRQFWTTQLAVFRSILRFCSEAGGRILSIHSRHSATAVLDALEDNRDAGVPILHWFSGTHGELARAIDMGCWFSIGPAMLGSEKGRALSKKMPRGRVLTESDGPFAQIDGRCAFPWDAALAEKTLADIWALPLEDAQAILDANLSNLLAR